MLINCYCFNFDINCRSERTTTFDFSHPAKLIQNFSTYYLSDLDVIPSEYMIDLLRELDDRAFSIQEISKSVTGVSLMLCATKPEDKRMYVFIRF